MIRILIIEPAGGLRGSERALLDLIDAAAGLQIGVCCPPAAPLIAELRRRGVPVLPHFVAGLHLTSRWRRVLAAFGVLWACLRFRPQLIHLNQSGAYKTALPAAALLNLPIVGHVRLFEDARYLARARPSPRRLKALIAVSEAVKTELRSFPALGAVPVHRLYDAFSAAPLAAPRRIAGRIACIGEVTPDKGQELLLQAMNDAALADACCLMAGDGEADYVRRLRALPGRVDWRGFVADVAPLLATSAVLACPSSHETLGRVVLEAWSQGAIPVAFAGSGGAAEVIAAAGGGLLYPEQTPDSLADALAAALALNAVEVERLTHNGRAWVAENCDPARYGASLKRLFASLVAPPPGFEDAGMLNACEA
jgi:glycosyltransferase involved in cell wall biosynthesis